VAERTLRGKLLVAQPGLLDPNFLRTVVLVLQHNDDGAIGVVLNRPSEVDAGDPLGAWGRFAAPPAVIFVGGPVVEEDTAICLARVRRDPGGEVWKEVIEGVGTLDINHPPDGIEAAVDEIRLFAGYAGWTAGQLDAEIEAGGWFVLDPHPIDGFTADPPGLWKAVVGRQPGMTSWFANYPPDAAMN
jgi:putative transcriptional regulator